MVRKTTIKNIDADNSVIKALEAKLARLEAKLQAKKLAEVFASRGSYQALPLAA